MSMASHIVGWAVSMASPIDVLASTEDGDVGVVGVIGFGLCDVVCTYRLAHL